jgi:hypothetical protein
MKEWICDEASALTLNGKTIATMLHKLQELVRCKNCRYSRSYSNGALYGCEKIDGMKEPDWFCADGERAE